MLCGDGVNATVLEPDGGGLTLCYRASVFLVLPTAFALGGSLVALVRERKVRVRTLHPVRAALRAAGAVDWLRMLVFALTGLAPAVLYGLESSRWDDDKATAGLPPFRIVEMVLLSAVPWLLVGVTWIVYEVRRGAEEWTWLRAFTLVEVIAESLRLWSEVRNLDNDYASQGHRDFAVMAGLTNLLLKMLASFLMICFRRDWRRLRRILRAQAGDIGELDSLDRADSTLEQPLADHDGLNRDASASDAEAHGADDHHRERTPEQYAGLLSRLFFAWMEPIMLKGSTRELEQDDFYKLLQDDDVNRLAREFSEKFAEARVEAEAAQPASSSPPANTEGSDQYVRLEDAEAEQSGAARRGSSKDRDAEKGDLGVIVRAMHRAGILTPFYQAAFFKWIYDSLMFVGPQLLRVLINYLNSEDEPRWKGYLYVALMFGSALTQTFVLHVYFHKVFRTGMRVRSSLLTSIYRKSLRLTPSARQQRTTGEVVNLMSTDCERLNSLFPYLHVTWSSPYQVALALFFLWGELKYAVLVAVGVIFLVMTPVTALVAGRIKSIQQELMKVKDARIRATGEAITSIKVIKLYGWERTFREQVAGAREDELRLLRRYVLWRAGARTLWSATPVFVTLCTFATFVLMGGTLDAATAFTSLSLLGILRFPLAVLPNIFNSAVEASVSLRRIANFLDTEELDSATLEMVRKNTTMEADQAVVVRHGTFFWDDKMTQRALSDVNVELKEGSLTVVTGEVGSGKSAFLGMLIGELQPAHEAEGQPLPEVGVRGTIAYAAQVPWIQNATLRDNVLFGCPYDREWYNHVVRSCSLEADLEQLPDGDQTEIGERGINLSGGQKARVALARAVYSRADVLLLETCFEAVDEHVGAALWAKCFQGILKEPNPTTGRRRTTVLVTHALKYVHSADQVLVLKNGKVVEQGLYDDIVRDRDSELARLAVRVDERKESVESEGAATDGADDGATGPLALKRKQSSFTKVRRKDDDKGGLTGKEERAVGQVSWSVYRQYMEAVGGPVVVLSVLLGLGIRTGLDTATSAWLAYWSSNAKEAQDPDADLTPSFNMSGLVAVAVSAPLRALEPGLLGASDAFSTSPRELMHAGIRLLNETAALEGGSSNGSTHGTAYFLGIYTAFSLGSLVFIGALTLYLAIVALVASRKMHNAMLNAVCRAPMAFFDTTPIGRILNRFSKDVYTIDETLPDSMYSFLSCVFQVVGTIATIAAVTPAFLLVVPVLGVVYLRIQRYYIATSRQVKRWDSVLRSPIYSHFSESLDGVSTIRAYGAARRFAAINQSQLGTQLGAYYISIASNRWLAVRLEFIGACLVMFTSLFVVLFRADKNAAFSALAISYSLNITQTLNWTVRMSSEIETNVISVERVNEYIETEPEAAEEDPDQSVVPAADSAWPEHGEIIFENVSARYRPGLEEVLRNVSIHIKPGEKVGIVGRTGSGKSTTFLVLLRLIEPSQGRILIDGYDTAKFGLERLRQACAIIPQDPVMFSATLRQNLDPLEQFTDEEIWRALEITNLKKQVEDLTAAGSEDDSAVGRVASGSALDVMITEGGSNFSFGQRQLICIARAILRRCKIILLDEATSGVDAATDNAIQKTIVTEFKDATVLTIAHRLTTIENGDKVLVMEKGEAAEFDAPDVLRQNSDSLFYKLMQQMKKKSS